MTRYRTQSATVLNEADRFEDILNVMLFNQEQDARIWADGDGWRPGVPLHQHPFYLDDGDGVYPRSMMELVEEREWHMRCKDCLVNWVGPDPCWMCGKEGPRRNWAEPEYLLRFDVRHQISCRSVVNQEALDRWNELMTVRVRPMADAFQEAARSLQERYATIWRSIQADWFAVFEEVPSIFSVKSPVVEHDCGEAFDQLYDPRLPINPRPGIALPKGLDLSGRRDIPALELEFTNADLERYKQTEERYWVKHNPPMRGSKRCGSWKLAHTRSLS